MTAKVFLASPPDSLCLLRLSALGDIAHTVPVVRALQRHWPHIRITWIIGGMEAQLVCDLPGVEFIIFDKSAGIQAWRKLYGELRGRRFDMLLHMQMSWRASMISLMIDAPIKLGFDRPRAKDLQWLFTTHQIASAPRQHVIESFLEFPRALGIEDLVPHWDIPIPEDDRAFAAEIIPADRPSLIISPCSLHAYRNWHAQGYAAVADYAHRSYDMQVILSGGPSAIEKRYAREIGAAVNVPINDLVGKTSLKQLLALLERAAAVIAPDSGPAHLASTAGTPVIGLYAGTNPERSRPFLSERWTVNKYPQALRAAYGLEIGQERWDQRVRRPGTMQLITVDDVTEKLDALMKERRRRAQS